MALYELRNGSSWDDESREKRPAFQNLAPGFKDPKTGKVCQQCENFNGGGLHFGSPMCKSNGLGAPNGRRAHCTCDACY